MTDFKDNAAELENMCKIFRERFQGPPLHSRKPEKGSKALNQEKKAEKLLSKKWESRFYIMTSYIQYYDIKMIFMRYIKH